MMEVLGHQLMPLPAGKSYHGASGIQTAGLGYSGYRGGAGVLTTSEEYDGTNWTSGGTLGTARYSVHSTQGTQTASFLAGGLAPPSQVKAVVEEYNGTSWSEVNNLPAGSFAQAGAGTLTAGLVAGGSSTSPSNTITTSLEYDGTNWSATPSLANARRGLGGAGATSSAAVVFGGQSPVVALTEEYNFTANTVTAAAWASGGALSTKRYAVGGTGTQTAGLAVGGTTYPIASVNATEEYGGCKLDGRWKLSNHYFWNRTIRNTNISSGSRWICTWCCGCYMHL